MLSVLAGSCTSDGSTGDRDTTTSPEVSTPTTAGTTTTDPSTAWPLKDLSERPQIWFGPLDPLSWERKFPEASYQFYELFTDDAPWQTAADAVHVVRLYAGWTAGGATPDDLERVLDDLRDRRIAISYESGPLQEHGECNAARIEGFAGAPAARTIVERIEAAGGVLHAMDLQHGFDAATYHAEACRMAPVEIAEDVSQTIEVVQETFPGVEVGSIETANMDVDDVAAWLEAYRAVMGEELSHFHLDVNYTVPDWAERAKAIEDHVRSRGIDFGIFYRGDVADTSDEQWLERAEDRVIEYEVLAGGRPDHVIFQSWHPHPQRLLPESEPDTFTQLIARYTRPRSELTLEVSDRVARGVLTVSDGSPVSGGPVKVSMTPLTGDGVFGEYAITGTVPEGTVEANVGVRINTECGCSGDADVTLDEVSYTEPGGPGGAVPNGGFDGGTSGWGVHGEGVNELTAGEDGAGAALHLEASLEQGLLVNSQRFNVTPGEHFTVTFRARVRPGSEGSGYFALFFLDEEGEISRSKTPLQAGAVTVGTAETGEDGGYALDLSDLPDGPLEVRAWFPGGDTMWPAVATQTIS